MSTHLILTAIILGVALAVSYGSASAPSARPLRLRVLFTHDLHSALLPRRVESADGTITSEGGFARLAHIIRSITASATTPLITVDAGDFSSGTPFHILYDSHATELRLLGALGYDAATFGNHDFDFGPSVVARMLRTARNSANPLPLLIASNMDFGPDGDGDCVLKRAFSETGVVEHTVIVRQGVRIGLFALMGRDAAEVMNSIAPVSFPDPVATARRIADHLRTVEHADIVICLSHCGSAPGIVVSEDEPLAEAVPGIDLIISGHSHTLLDHPRIIGSTAIVAAGAHGANLGDVTLERGTDGRWTVAAYDLHHVGPETPEAADVRDSIVQFQEHIDRECFALYGYSHSQVLARAAFSLQPRGTFEAHALESGLGDLIADACRHAVRMAEGASHRHVHVALLGQGLIREALLKGPITVGDVFRVLSLGLGPDGLPGYSLVVSTITGADLKTILEVESSIAPSRADVHFQVSGVRFVYNPNRVYFDRIRSIDVEEADGTWRPLDRSRLYRICLNNYMISMVSMLESRTYGILTADFRDSTDRVIDDYSRCTVTLACPDSVPRACKEWQALAMYLASFPDTDGDGIPDIPERYSRPAGRITVEASWNPVKLIQGATWITYTFLALGLGVGVAVAGGVRWMIRQVRRIRKD